MKLVSVKNCFLKLLKYARLFKKMPVYANGMDLTHKCRHFPNPVRNVIIHLIDRLTYCQEPHNTRQ